MGVRSMNILNFHKTERSLLRAAVLLVLLVCGFLVLVDELSIYCGLGIVQRVADDFAGGIIAASIFYLYERRARRQIHEQLRLVDLMNHHIRNALQPLMFVPFQPEAAVQKQLVEECVDHIDWALREILPGKSHERFAVKTADFANSRRGPENCKPQTFFGQWFESWQNRNRTATDEPAASGFSDRVNSGPWKNSRAAFPQSKHGGHDA
jgi:hypothetical protein